MTSLDLPPDLKAGLDALKERDGVLQSEAIRRAVRMFLEAKGIDVERLKEATARTKGRRA
jgi:metal-responsive CopG/Arc/MetJ family transcriptional regulator